MDSVWIIFYEWMMAKNWHIEKCDQLKWNYLIFYWNKKFNFCLFFQHLNRINKSMIEWETDHLKDCQLMDESINILEISNVDQWPLENEWAFNGDGHEWINRIDGQINSQTNLHSPNGCWLQNFYCYTIDGQHHKDDDDDDYQIRYYQQ